MDQVGNQENKSNESKENQEEINFQKDKEAVFKKPFPIKPSGPKLVKPTQKIITMENGEKNSSDSNYNNNQALPKKQQEMNFDLKQPRFEQNSGIKIPSGINKPISSGQTIAFSKKLPGINIQNGNVEPKIISLAESTSLQEKETTDINDDDISIVGSEAVSEIPEHIQSLYLLFSNPDKIDPNVSKEIPKGIPLPSRRSVRGEERMKDQGPAKAPELNWSNPETYGTLKSSEKPNNIKEVQNQEKFSDSVFSSIFNQSEEPNLKNSDIEQVVQNPETLVSVDDRIANSFRDKCFKEISQEQQEEEEQQLHQQQEFSQREEQQQQESSQQEQAKTDTWFDNFEEEHPSSFTPSFLEKSPKLTSNVVHNESESKDEYSFSARVENALRKEEQENKQQQQQQQLSQRTMSSTDPRRNSLLNNQAPSSKLINDSRLLSNANLSSRPNMMNNNRSEQHRQMSDDEANELLEKSTYIAELEKLKKCGKHLTREDLSIHSRTIDLITELKLQRDKAYEISRIQDMQSYLKMGAAGIAAANTWFGPFFDSKKLYDKWSDAVDSKPELCEALMDKFFPNQTGGTRAPINPIKDLATMVLGTVSQTVFKGEIGDFLKRAFKFGPDAVRNNGGNGQSDPFNNVNQPFHNPFIQRGNMMPFNPMMNNMYMPFANVPQMPFQQYQPNGQPMMNYPNAFMGNNMAQFQNPVQIPMQPQQAQQSQQPFHAQNMPFPLNVPLANNQQPNLFQPQSQPQPPQQSQPQLSQQPQYQHQPPQQPQSQPPQQPQSQPSQQPQYQPQYPQQPQPAQFQNMWYGQNMQAPVQQFPTGPSGKRIRRIGSMKDDLNE